jgi:hypothetical protein
MRTGYLVIGLAHSAVGFESTRDTDSREYT